MESRLDGRVQVHGELASRGGFELLSEAERNRLMSACLRVCVLGTEQPASAQPCLRSCFFFLCQRFRPCSYGASSFWSCVGLLAGEAFQNQTLSSQPAPLSTLVLPFDQNDAVSHFLSPSGLANHERD